MSKRHAPSFLFSLVVHILALFIIYYTYEYVAYLHHKDVEKKVCINLKLCIPEEKTAKNKINKIKKIKEVKEIKKVKKRKELKKVIIKKKKVLKKKVAEKKAIIPSFSVPVIKKEIVPDATPVTKEVKEPTTTPTHTIEKIYIDNNLKKISQLLSDNLYYPRRARKRGITGEVLVNFKILQDGTVNAIKIISSKSEILGKAATKTISDLSGKFPKPSKDLTIEIPIEYKLH